MINDSFETWVACTVCLHNCWLNHVYSWCLSLSENRGFMVLIHKPIIVLPFGAFICHLQSVCFKYTANSFLNYSSNKLINLTFRSIHSLWFLCIGLVARHLCRQTPFPSQGSELTPAICGHLPTRHLPLPHWKQFTFLRSSCRTRTDLGGWGVASRQWALLQGEKDSLGTFPAWSKC